MSDFQPAQVERFMTTRWSIVLSAGRDQAADAGGAMETLCGSYWYPLYAFARRRGHSADDAKDLTQEFFSRLLERDFLQTNAASSARSC